MQLQGLAVRLAGMLSPSGGGGAASNVPNTTDGTGATGPQEAPFTNADSVGSPTGMGSSAQAALLDEARGAAYKLDNVVSPSVPQPSSVPVPPPSVEPQPGRGPTTLFSSEDPVVLFHFVRRLSVSGVA